MNKDDNYDIIANRTDNAATDESPQYKYFDWVRTVNSDMAGGIYSVTDTWTLFLSTPHQRTNLTLASRAT